MEMGQTNRTGHAGVVARWDYLYRRVLQDCREAHLLEGRVSEGSGPSLQLESRRKRTPRDRHPRRRTSRRVRLQGARPPGNRPQQFGQVETFEEGEGPGNAQGLKLRCVLRLERALHVALEALTG